MARDRVVLSPAVCTTMPSSALRTQAACSTRLPSTSTTHMRHTPTGSNLGE